MTEYDKTINELGEHIDVKIGRVNTENTSQHSKKNFEEEMLIIARKQTEYLRQIKNMVSFVFYLLIISLLITCFILLLNS